MNADELLALNPFPGLRSFAPDESDMFFGREDQIEELLRVVDANAFVAVAGPSGSGKSSIVLAGLFKALTQRAQAGGGAAFRPVVLRPGGQPIARLHEPLARAIGQAESPEAIGALYGRLRLSALGLVDAVRQANLPQGEQVIVVVDQFEEIFRFERISDPEEANAFVKLLLQPSFDPSVSLRVVITLRSDAIGYCANFPGLAEAVSRGLVLIPKLTRDQRKEAIIGPVQRRGFGIRPSLVQRLLNDVPDDFDDLPVMQHALTRTWSYWAAHSSDETGRAGARDIEIDDYEKIGTSHDALDQHGKQLLDKLTPELRAVAARVMRALTERRPDSIEVRRPLPFDELCRVVGATEGDTDSVARVVNHLRSPQACFMQPPDSESLASNPVIDITHESLIRQWTSLREWVQAESISRAKLDRLLQAAKRHAEGDGDLWKKRELNEALEWKHQEKPNEAWVRLCAGEAGAAQWPQALQFMTASAAEVQAERRRRLLGRWAGALLAVGLIAAIGIAAFSMLSFGTANRQRLSQELANLGWQELRLDPALSAHLALAALDQDSNDPQAEQVLRQSVETLMVSHTEHIFEFGSPIVDARPNRDRTRIAILSRETLAIVDAKDAHDVEPRRALPWPATNVWLLDERGLVVLQFESNGVRIQAGDGKVLVDWNCPGGEKDDSVYTAQVSADGRWLTAGCRYGQIALWSLPEHAGPLGPPALLAKGSGGTVTAIAFTADDRWLAAGDSWGQVRVWNLENTKQPLIGKIQSNHIDSPVNHTQSIRDIDIWENDLGSFIATGSDDGTAVVWQLDLDHGRLLGKKNGGSSKLTMHAGRPVIRVHRDGLGQLMTISDRRLQFWGADEKALPVDTHHNSWITDVDVSPDSQYVISSSDDGIARVWSRDRGAVATLIGHRNAVTRSRFIAEDRVITASSDGTLRMWRLAPVSTLHYSPDKWISSAAPSPDGKELALCGERGTVGEDYCGVLPLTGDAEEARHEKPIRLSLAIRADAIRQLLWTAGGSRVVATTTQYDLMGLGSPGLPLDWDHDKAPVLARRPGDAILAQCPQRSETVSINDKGDLEIERQDGSRTTPVVKFAIPGSYYGQAAALSADGRWVATTDDKSIWVFDRNVPGGAPRQLQGHQGSVTSLDFSPDSRYLASAGTDRNAKIWSLFEKPGTPPVEMTGGHSAAIYKVAFNHLGTQIATGGGDGTIRMWDAKTGHELVSLDWHSAAVNDLRFHPTDDVIFTASDDGTVKRGECRTCNKDIAQLRDLVVHGEIAQLTQRDAQYVKRASVEGARAKR